MKSLKLGLIGLLFFVQNIFAQNPIVGLASPIQLQPDSTLVLISDYFPFQSTIDSVKLFDGLQLGYLSKDSIIIKGSLTNLYSTLAVYIDQDKYEILIKQSAKKSFTMNFNLPIPVNELAIKGSFSAWVASTNGLRPFGPKPSNHWVWEAKGIDQGSHQFKLIADGKELDPLDLSTVPNGLGGTNVQIQVGATSANLPIIATKTFINNNIILTAKNCTQVFCFWQNQLIYQSTKIKSEIKFTIPAIAKDLDRSFIRVYAANENTISNDLLIPLAKGQVLTSSAALDRSDLHAQILYFLMVDRFVDGDTTNNPKRLADVLPIADYMGGDLQGVNQKIKQGYFDDLGINAIWLSPISENPAGAFGFWNKGVTTKFSGYHGYWPTSYAKVDARFGTNQGFQSLITTAHEKQYNVILDFVAHHIHTDHPLYKQHPEWVTPLYLPDGSMNTERWDDYRLTTWFDTFLPTLLMEKEAVREVVSDSVLFWMKNFEIDGFRHDASKHVPEDFWRLLTKKIKRIQVEKKRNNFFQIGETYGSPALIGSYVNSGEMDGQFDFNLYDAAVNAFAANGDAAKDFKQLALTLNQSTSTYGNHHLMGNITGNQDKPRFISLADGSVSNAGDTKLQGWTNNIQNKGDLGFDKLAQMMAFNLTVPGVPVIYYGDEIGLPGANDPDNRRMMQFSNLNENQLKMKEITKQLIDFRRNKLELIYGELTILPIHENVFAFERNYFGKKTIIIFSKTKQTINFPMSDALTWTSQLEHQLTKDKKSITLSLKANDFEIISNY